VVANLADERPDALANRRHGIVVGSRVVRSNNVLRRRIKQDRLGGRRARIHAENHRAGRQRLKRRSGHDLDLVREAVERRERFKDRRV